LPQLLKALKRSVPTMLNPTPAKTNFLKLARNHPRATDRQQADYFPKTKLQQCEVADI
jgi:hypothetical protein